MSIFYILTTALLTINKQQIKCLLRQKLQLMVC